MRVCESGYAEDCEEEIFGEGVKGKVSHFVDVMLFTSKELRKRK